MGSVKKKELIKKENTKKAIEEFYKIRDIPYHISLNGEPEHCCEGKSRLLAKKLIPLGYKPFLRGGLFRWSDLGLPKKLNTVKHEDLCLHFFLEVENLEYESVFVDTTWNPELGKAGFSVSEWDGIGSTTLAMPCRKIFSRRESEEQLNSFKYLDVMFYDAFNQYCDSFLKKKGSL